MQVTVDCLPHHGQDPEDYLPEGTFFLDEDGDLNVIASVRDEEMAGDYRTIRMCFKNDGDQLDSGVMVWEFGEAPTYGEADELGFQIIQVGQRITIEV